MNKKKHQSGTYLSPEAIVRSITVRAIVMASLSGSNEGYADKLGSNEEFSEENGVW